MRKKNLFATAMMVVCLGLAACGGNQDAGKSRDTQTQTQQQVEAAGFVYESNGVAMSINGKVDEYVSKLGTPSGGYYEAKSCAFEGLDKFWYYDGFTLQAYQKDGADVLYSVTFDDDTVKTKEGVKIGDAKDKMTTAYGTGFKQSDTVYSYESGDMVLQFTIKDDVITNIVYMLKTA